MHPSQEKQDLRESIKERISHMPEKTRKAEERSLCKRLRELLGSEPKTIAAFVPLKDEVDIRPLLTELLSEHWNVFLPVFEGGKLAFHQATTLSDLKPGHLGIPEPSHQSPLLDPSALDIVLVPARAFTKDGDRLGRGNGGYDVWIRKQRSLHPQTQFIGIALECQVVPSIPMEAHDEKVDAVVTARS